MDRGLLGKEYADRDVICRQGEPGDRMYVIQAGRAEVVREDDGREVFVGELAKGDVFGEMAIVDRQPRSATVRAKGSTRVLTLDRRAFLRGVHEDPSLAYRVLQSMSRRIRRLDEDVSLLRLAPSAGRPAPDGGRYLVIVARERPDLYERLVRALASDTAIRVLMDRRSEDRRQDAGSHAEERRQSQRRDRNVDEMLQKDGVVFLRAD